MRILGIITMVVVIIVLGGCAASMISLGNAVDDGEKKSESFAAVRDQIQIGMSCDEVRRIAGEPEDVQEFADGSGTSETLYYGVLSQDSYQVVCDGTGTVTAINRY